MSKKENVTGRLGWQGKAETDHKDRKFFPIYNHRRWSQFLRSYMEDPFW